MKHMRRKQLCLALEVSPNTVHRWTKDGLPYDHLDGFGVRVYDVDVVREWVAANRPGWVLEGGKLLRAEECAEPSRRPEKGRRYIPNQNNYLPASEARKHLPSVLYDLNGGQGSIDRWQALIDAHGLPGTAEELRQQAVEALKRGEY